MVLFHAPTELFIVPAEGNNVVLFILGRCVIVGSVVRIVRPVKRRARAGVLAIGEEGYS